MKKILLSIFLLVSLVGYSQYPPNGTKNQWKNGLALGGKDSTTFGANDSLILTIDRNGKLLWRGNGASATWKVATDASSGGSGTVTSIATNNGTGINGGTITTSGTLAIDTTNISTRLFRIKGTDSLAGLIALKVNISDTANMLSTYQRVLANYSTTYALSNDVRDSIQTKLALSDTSAMLSPYRRTSTAITQSEVTGLTSALAGKLNVSDTAAMLAGNTLDRVLVNGASSERAATLGTLNIGPLAALSVNPLQISASDAGLTIFSTNTGQAPATYESYVAHFLKNGAGAYHKYGVTAVQVADTSSTDGVGSWNEHVTVMNSGVNTDEYGLIHWGRKRASLFSPQPTINYAPLENTFQVNGNIISTDSTTTHDLFVNNSINQSVSSNSFFNTLSLKNSNAGSLASNRFRIGNDAGDNAFTIDVNSSTFTGARYEAKILNQFNASLKLGGYGTAALNLRNGGNVDVTDTLTANVIIKNGATSSQFLKGDGSVDGNTYLTSSDISGKLNVSDTTSMLSHYRRTSTAITQSEVSGLSTSLAAKLNVSDTASMLARSPLVNRFLDTAAALQGRIETKSPLAGSSAITTVGTLSSGSIPYSLLTGTPSLNYLPLAGGILTGTLTGTTASFSSSSNGTLDVLNTRNTSTGTSAVNRFNNGNNASPNAFTIKTFSSTHSTFPNVTQIYNEFAANLELGSNGVTALTIAPTGAITASNLAGTGDRMVVASSTGVLSASQIVTSGTYTPTLTNTTNISSSTLYQASYTRIGNVITVSIGGTITPSSAASTVLTFTLPISSSNGTQTMCGSASIQGNSGSYYTSGVVSVNSTTTATLTWLSANGGTSPFNVTFQYSL